MANRQNTLLLKRSNVIGKLPPLSGLTLGEMALNTADAKLYTLFTSGTTGATEVRQIGWDRISRTGDTVTGDFNFFGDITISGSSLPNGYALAVTGDTDFKSDVYVEGDIYFSGNVITTGSTIIQNGLTANTIYTDYIDFNLTATSVHNEGRLNWNDDTKTLEIDTEVNDFSVEIGQENVIRVSNKTGNLLTKGTLVFITGGTNNRPTVSLASRDAERTSARTLGFVGHNIDPDAEGYVVTYGLLRDINTIAYTAGTQLYLFTGGTWTNEKPIAPDHDVRVGVVIRQSLGAGIIFVTVQNGYELDEIHDVRISGLTAGDLLVQSSFNDEPVWINSKTLPGNYTISGNTTHIGNFNITGNTTQIGDVNLSGNTSITGNTTQYGNTYISGTSMSGQCAFKVDGNVCIDGDITISGDTFMSGDFCMNNMNSGGLPTGTNCFDTNLIPTGTTIIHQFQPEGGVLAHLNDLATGEPNSRGYTFFENNTVLTSFVSVGTGVYTPIIGAPQTIVDYNNLFSVTTGETTSTTNKMTYIYPPATGGTVTYLKFNVSLSVEAAQNQNITFQLQRNRSMVITNIPIGMSVTPTGNGGVSVAFNGVADANFNDEFTVVVKNNTGSGAQNSVRITNFSFSMFT